MRAAMPARAGGRTRRLRNLDSPAAACNMPRSASFIDIVEMLSWSPPRKLLAMVYINM